MSEGVPARHPFSIIFLLHIALDVPMAVQGLWSPAGLPFMQLNNTALVFIKLYAALVTGTCIMSLLCFSLPEFLPGKRALAIALCVYHATVSTVLFNAPRFIPHTFGAIAESWRATPEVVWGTLHGLLGLGFAVWWQVTVPMAAMVAKMKLQ